MILSTLLACLIKFSKIKYCFDTDLDTDIADSKGKPN